MKQDLDQPSMPERASLAGNTREALSVLSASELWDSGRAADLQWFQFGRRRRVRTRQGGTKAVGQFALHVQCAWRLRSSTGIVAGSGDRYYARDDLNGPNKASSGWDRRRANRSDEQLSAFFKPRRSAPPVVEAVKTDPVGGFCLMLSQGFALEVFPDTTSPGERWRLFQPYSEKEHFVVTEAGIERQ
jgi:hypothetical protein